MLDLVVWAAIALLLQVATVSILRRMVPAVGEQLSAGAVASGVFFAALAVAVGLLNAAAMLF
jgi:putative membrane protein